MVLGTYRFGNPWTGLAQHAKSTASSTPAKQAELADDRDASRQVQSDENRDQALSIGPISGRKSSPSLRPKNWPPVRTSACKSPTALALQTRSENAFTASLDVTADDRLFPSRTSDDYRQSAWSKPPRSTACSRTSEQMVKQMEAARKRSRSGSCLATRTTLPVAIATDHQKFYYRATRVW
mgnify:CR=1 FL=1